jgi:carboxymethylenebutenolidase
MALREYLAEEVALEYAAQSLTRREAFRRLAMLGVTAGAASTLLAACGGDDSDSGASATTSNAQTGGAQPTSASSTSSSPTGAPPVEDITFPGPNGNLFGAWSAAGSPRGAVLVIHENRGLTPHIRSLPRRFAADGYSALAVDLLSEEGGTAAVGDSNATAALGQASTERMIGDLRAGIDELQRRVPGAAVAVVGFCFGGGMTWQLLASGEPRLATAVPFYGPAPDNPDFSGSKAAVLGIYAGNDDRVNATRDRAEQALRAAGLTYEMRTFPGVDHAFFNDTGPRYNATAATDAYAAVLAWFGTHLK